jgi:hypothetical protein
MPSDPAPDVEPQPCPGCGLVAPPAQGPTHAYIGASPGCWATFGALLLEPFGAAGSGQLLTDAYAVQHPGVPERRAIQSVCLHLILLCATLERGWPPQRAVHLRRQALARPPVEWRWLDPPLPLGSLTIAQVAVAADAAQRGRRLRTWADDVWSAYGAHHGEIRGWVDALLK